MALACHVDRLVWRANTSSISHLANHHHVNHHHRHPSPVVGAQDDEPQTPSPASIERPSGSTAQTTAQSTTTKTTTTTMMTTTTRVEDRGTLF